MHSISRVQVCERQYTHSSDDNNIIFHYVLNVLSSTDYIANNCFDFEG